MTFITENNFQRKINVPNIEVHYTKVEAYSAVQTNVVPLYKLYFIYIYVSGYREILIEEPI